MKSEITTTEKKSMMGIAASVMAVLACVGVAAMAIYKNQIR